MNRDCTTPTKSGFTFTRELIPGVTRPCRRYRGRPWPGNWWLKTSREHYRLGGDGPEACIPARVRTSMRKVVLGAWVSICWASRALTVSAFLASLAQAALAQGHRPTKLSKIKCKLILRIMNIFPEHRRACADNTERTAGCQSLNPIIKTQNRMAGFQRPDRASLTPCPPCVILAAF